MYPNEPATEFVYRQMLGDRNEALTNYVERYILYDVSYYLFGLLAAHPRLDASLTRSEFMERYLENQEPLTFLDEGDAETRDERRGLFITRSAWQPNASLLWMRHQRERVSGHSHNNHGNMNFTSKGIDWLNMGEYNNSGETTGPNLVFLDSDGQGLQLVNNRDGVLPRNTSFVDESHVTGIGVDLSNAYTDYFDEQGNGDGYIHRYVGLIRGSCEAALVIDDVVAPVSQPGIAQHFQMQTDVATQEVNNNLLRAVFSSEGSNSTLDMTVLTCDGCQINQTSNIAIETLNQNSASFVTLLQGRDETTPRINISKISDRVYNLDCPGTGEGYDVDIGELELGDLGEGKQIRRIVTVTPK
jgi:hypothetical protein